MIDNWAHDAAATALVRFHPPATGLWRGANAYSPTDPGSLTCPDGAVVSHPTPNGAWGGVSGDVTGNCRLLQVPSPPGDQRTAGQVAIDNSAHRQVRLYGLVAGAAHTLYGKSIYNIDGSGGIGFIYVDPVRVRWHIQVTTVHAASECTATIKVRRFGHFDPGRTFAVLTKVLSAPAGTLANNSGVALLAYRPDGGEAWFGAMRTPPAGGSNNPWGGGSAQQDWPTCFWRLGVTGTGDETAVDHGLAFSWERDVPERVHEREVNQIVFGAAHVPGPAEWTGDAPQQNGTWRYPYNKVNVGPQDGSGGIAPVPNCLFGWRDENYLTQERNVYTYRLWPAYTAAGDLVWLTVRHEVYTSLHYVQTVSYAAYHVDVVNNVFQSPVVEGTDSYSWTLDNDEWQRWTLSLGGMDILDETHTTVDVHTSGSGAETDRNTNRWSASYSQDYIGAVAVAYYVVPFGVFDTPDYNTMDFRWDLPAGPIVLPGDGSRYDPMVALSVVRYSASLFGGFRRTSVMHYPGGSALPYEDGVVCELVNAAGPEGAISSFTEACINTGPAPTQYLFIAGQPNTIGKFGSYHPVTQSIAWDTVPICWL